MAKPEQIQVDQVSLFELPPTSQEVSQPVLSPDSSQRSTDYPDRNYSEAAQDQGWGPVASPEPDEDRPRRSPEAIAAEQAARDKRRRRATPPVASGLTTRQVEALNPSPASTPDMTGSGHRSAQVTASELLRDIVRKEAVERAEGDKTREIAHEVALPGVKLTIIERDRIKKRAV